MLSDDSSVLRVIVQFLMRFHHMLASHSFTLFTSYTKLL